MSEVPMAFSTENHEAAKSAGLMVVYLGFAMDTELADVMAELMAVC